MIAKDLQLYSVVDDAGFRYFVNAAEPRYQIPSRTVMSRKIIPEMDETEVEKIKLNFFLFEKVITAVNSLARGFLKLNLLIPLRGS